MRLIIATVLAMMLGISAIASDIVTMPTANQLKKGDVEVAGYHLWLDLPAGFPQSVEYQTIYVGVTDQIEIDAHRSDVDNDKSSVVFVGSYKLLSESKTQPDLVVGIRNFTSAETTNNPAVKNKSSDPSYYVSAAKTFFLKPGAPQPPLIRAHLSVGTADWTLLGEKRHQGVFGGVQALVTPWLGLVAEDDGTDLITAITFMPAKVPGLVIKGGTFGNHTWVGVAYQKNLF